MKSQLQVAMAALFLGMSSIGVAYADDTDRMGGNHDMDDWGEHESIPRYEIPKFQDCKECEGHFQVKVHVPQTCEVKVKRDVVFLKAGGEAHNWFSVKTNGSYNLKVSADNQTENEGFKSEAKGANGSVGLTYTTTSGGNTYKLGKTYSNLPKTQKHYKVAIAADAAGMQDAGWYTDKYNIQVHF